ncbi:hypothetical protein LOK49_LG12G00202 [Camellia lanceoleosa]|uniref:Uncharacterized protein n=1 Tax=Camellia lanceoleosa TaxID=1840588 RepID=A0ACC0FV55_9ERIC|nr:hypothetical protein LOK49_LG12G00202 [Camellia lanceoleosa]
MKRLAKLSPDSFDGCTSCIPRQFCTHHKIEQPEVAQHMGAPIAGNILIAFVADMVKENQIRYDDLALDSNCTQEHAGIGSLVKGFRQYLIWDRRRRTFKRVN